MPRAPKAPNEHAAERIPWAGSDRRDRLPPDWAELRRLKAIEDPAKTCHICQAPGGDTLDHVIPGDDHSPENLAWAHDRRAPHCHRYKSAQEGVAGRRARKCPP